MSSNSMNAPLDPTTGGETKDSSGSSGTGRRPDDAAAERVDCLPAARATAQEIERIRANLPAELLEQHRWVGWDGTRLPPPLDRVLEELKSRGCRVRHSGRKIMAQCPAHDDQRESLSIGLGNDGRVLAYCHAGCDLRHEVIPALGLRPADLFPERSKTYGDGRHRADQRRAAVAFDIRDINGNLVAQHHRVETLEGKRMWWSRPGLGNGLGGLRTTDLPLFGSEMVRDGGPDAPIVLVEGEKAALALRDWVKDRMLVLATVTGAGSTPSDASLSVLAEREVLLWPDADAKGRRHMALVAERLRGVARSVRSITWTNAPPGGDAADFVGSAEELATLLEGAAPYDDLVAHADAEKDVSRTEDDEGPLTDITNARELVVRQGQDFRFTKALGWLRWDTVRWAPCKRGEELQAAVATVEALYDEAATHLGLLTKDLQDAGDAREGQEALKALKAEVKKAQRVVDHCVASQRLPRLQAMLTIAATDPAVAIDALELDRDPWLLNVQNGTIDLRSGEIREHRREDMITQVAGASYDPHASCELWMQTLHEVFAGPDVDEVVAYLQRLAGYSATGSVREEIFAVLWGSGRNGKGVITETLMQALGDYAKTAPMSLFLESRGDGARRFAVAEYRAVRMLVASEANEGRAFDIAMLKQWTGGDPRYAEKKGRDPFTYLPTDTPWLMLNDKPRVQSWDVAFEERLHLLPFEHSFTGERADKNRKTQLREGLDGVLAWVVAGAVAWHRDGLQPPARVRAAVADYRHESVHADEFVAERLMRIVGPSLLQSDVFAAYDTWSRQRGYPVVSDRKFSDYLERAGFARKRSKRGQMVLDAALRPNEPPVAGGDDGDDGVDVLTHFHSRKIDSPIGAESEQRHHRHLRHPEGQDPQPHPTPSDTSPATSKLTPPRAVPITTGRGQALTTSAIRRLEAGTKVSQSCRQDTRDGEGGNDQPRARPGS